MQRQGVPALGQVHLGRATGWPSPSSKATAPSTANSATPWDDSPTADAPGNPCREGPTACLRLFYPRPSACLPPMSLIYPYSILILHILYIHVRLLYRCACQRNRGILCSASTGPCPSSNLNPDCSDVERPPFPCPAAYDGPTCLPGRRGAPAAFAPGEGSGRGGPRTKDLPRNAARGGRQGSILRQTTPAALTCRCALAPTNVCLCG